MTGGDGQLESSGPLETFEAAEDAWWLEGRVVSERLPEIAASGLLGGLDSPALRALAGASPRDVRANRDLWERALGELGRAPPLVDPLARAAWKLLDAIGAGRVEPCRGARALYWLGWRAWQRDGLGGPQQQSELVQSLVDFLRLADDCEGWALDDRTAIRQEIIDRATALHAQIESEPPRAE